MKEKQEKTQTIRPAKIGGQAVLEGVMMHGQTAMALTVRSDDGLILTSTSRLKQRKKIRKIPVLRGIVAFGSSLVVGMRTLVASADMVSREEEKLSKGAYAFSIFAAIIIALGVFFFLPSLFGSFFYDKIFSSILLKNLASGVLRVALFVGYLWAVSLLKDMKRVFRYHGAEHKTINCYESGMDLTVENIKKCSRRHNRCGTTFLFLVMLVSILVFAFLDYGLNLLFGLNGLVRTFAFMGVKLLFLPIVAGISYEVLFFLARCKDNLFVRALRAPGLALQHLTTAEPDEQMIQIALISFNEVLAMDENPNIPAREFSKIPLKDCYAYLFKELDALQAEKAEADWMLCHVLLCRRSEIKTKQFMDLSNFRRLMDLVKKRKTMPLDYCLGTSCFCGYDVKVDGRVLVPRAETELLASLATELINKKGLTDVLELCTGSGCVALVMTKETNAKITASDVSKGALEVARQNLLKTNVQIVESDLFEAFSGQRFNMIIANPPYIALKDIEQLQFEVQCQPHIALNGGLDGLDFYRRIALEGAKHLTKEGIILLEIGANQAKEVSEILSAQGFKEIEVVKDLSGLDRIVRAQI